MKKTEYREPTIDELKEGFKEIEKEWEIERKIWDGTATSEDIDHIKGLLEKQGEWPAPLTQYVLGLAYHCGSGVEYDPKEGERWFNLCKKHANGDMCFRLSYAYANLGNEYIEQSMACLRRAKWHKHKLATAMLKAMEEHPFEFPKA